jgi:hypothetical protein
MKTKSYVGYTKTKRYRVIIKPVETEKNTIFSYYAEMDDLHQIIKNHINDFGEENFQIYVKLTELTEGGSSNVDVKVNVTFEETSNLFYVPKPVKIYTENGFFEIKCDEEYETTLFFSAIINYEEYPTQILKVLDGLIDEKGVVSTEMPIFIALVCYDFELDGYEIYPVSITVNFYPNEELSNSEKGQQERVLQFRDFVDNIVQEDGGIEKNKLERK